MTGDQRCQPSPANLRQRLRAMPSSLNDACRTMEEAADLIEAMSDPKCFTGSAVTLADKLDAIFDRIEVSCDWRLSSEERQEIAEAAKELRTRGAAQTAIIAPVESAGLRGAVKEALESHKSMLPAQPLPAGDKGEAVAWQYRTGWDGSDAWTDWLHATKEQHERIQRNGRVGYYKAESRALFAAPQPASNAYASSLPMEWICSIPLPEGGYLCGWMFATAEEGKEKLKAALAGPSLPSTQRDGEAVELPYLKGGLDGF